MRDNPEREHIKIPDVPHETNEVTVYRVIEAEVMMKDAFQTSPVTADEQLSPLDSDVSQKVDPVICPSIQGLE